MDTDASAVEVAGNAGGGDAEVSRTFDEAFLPSGQGVRAIGKNDFVGVVAVLLIVGFEGFAHGVEAVMGAFGEMGGNLVEGDAAGVGDAGGAVDDALSGGVVEVGIARGVTDQISMVGEKIINGIAGIDDDASACFWVGHPTPAQPDCAVAGDGFCADVPLVGELLGGEVGDGIVWLSGIDWLGWEIDGAAEFVDHLAEVRENRLADQERMVVVGAAKMSDAIGDVFEGIVDVGVDFIVQPFGTPDLLRAFIRRCE